MLATSSPAMSTPWVVRTDCETSSVMPLRCSAAVQVAARTPVSARLVTVPRTATVVEDARPWVR